MKKIHLLAAFLAVLLAIPSCEGVLTSNDANKSLQFPIYTCVGGITAKIVQGADLATKSENASYYTITAPDFPNAEPLIVEIIEISAGLTFMNHYCADGELIATFTYLKSELFEVAISPEFSIIDTKANGYRVRGEGYMACIRRVYHEMKEEGYENNEVICDFASPLCESVALYIAVVGCGYYEDQPVV